MIDIAALQKRTTEAVHKQIGMFRAEMAVVLGSGLSSLTSELENKKHFSYDLIPGLRKTSVEGHDGNFVYGELSGVKVLFLQGRPHWYEGASAESFHVFIQAIQTFGCKKILMTNAAGAIDTSIPVGSIVAITDHINLHFNNPLMGINSTNSRFVGLENAYDSVFRDNIESIATENNIKLYDISDNENDTDDNISIIAEVETIHSDDEINSEKTEEKNSKISLEQIEELQQQLPDLLNLLKNMKNNNNNTINSFQ